MKAAKQPPGDAELKWVGLDTFFEMDYTLVDCEAHRTSFTDYEQAKRIAERFGGSVIPEGGSYAVRVGL